MSAKIRILLADDHTLVRGGMRALIQSLPGMEVVAEVADGREALRLVDEYHPQVALIDIAMPGLNGLEATSRITRDFPTTRVIILSMHTNVEYVLQALRSGASGYLIKDSAIAELELAINAVTRGETYLSPPISRHVISEYVQRVSGDSGAVQPRSPLERLTDRQREILQLIAEGRTTQEIALLLNVSAKTVETHRMQLMDRLDIHDVAGLVRFAIKAGLIQLDE